MTLELSDIDTSSHLPPITVTVATARKVSGLGYTTIWALIKTGEIETTRVGRRRLILYSSLERLLTPEKSAA